MNLLITGGSNGIGAAIARDYGTRTGAGHRVFITGRDEGACAALCAEINAAAAAEQAAAAAAAPAAPAAERASFAVGDVGNEADVERVCAAAEAFFGAGGISVLVANAGCGGGRAPLEHTGAASFDRQFSANVRGVFLYLSRVLPAMRAARRGQLVVTSSVAGLRPVAHGAVYAASKWAVEGMVRSLREELRGSGVKAGTVNPGPVATKWWTEAHRGGERTAEQVPAAMLTAEDCARAAATIIDQAQTSDLTTVTLDAAAPPAAV
jgi:NADP-dependent 3-hydroxy acid dehydrogenase YdfG